jgi:hypothetical protein
MCAAMCGGWVDTLPPLSMRCGGNGWEAVVCERVGGLQQLLGGMRRALHAHRHRSVCPSRSQNRMATQQRERQPPCTPCAYERVVCV